MKLLAFAVYDAKAEAYLRPFFAETKGLAVRSFRDASNDPQHEMCRHAADYTLFEIGSFDQGTGVLSSLNHGAVSIGCAITFKEAVS